jgi:hypothetical protein
MPIMLGLTRHRGGLSHALERTTSFGDFTEDRTASTPNKRSTFEQVGDIATIYL